MKRDKGTGEWEASLAFFAGVSQYFCFLIFSSFFTRILCVSPKKFLYYPAKSVSCLVFYYPL